MAKADHSNIRIFARIRPARKTNNPSAVAVSIAKNDTDETTQSDDTVTFELGQLGARETQNTARGGNQRTRFGFKFDRVFDAFSGQQEVFDVVCAPVIQSVLSGYNGTLFAYGQV